jgi:hypothetical protein
MNQLKWNLEEDRPLRAIYVDGNDGTGKTTLVARLREYIAKLERLFGTINVEVHDRGVATQATEGPGPWAFRATDVYVFLDASPETSRQRLAARGADLSEKYHTIESLEDYRDRFLEIARQMATELGVQRGPTTGILVVNAEVSQRRVLVEVVRHLRLQGIFPKLSQVLKALAAESSMLALKKLVATERAERNANAVALAQAVIRADRAELEADKSRRTLDDMRTRLTRAKTACEGNSEATRFVEEALLNLSEGDPEKSNDLDVDELAEFAQTVKKALPEYSPLLRRLNAELLWRRCRDGLAPFQHDETQPPPGWVFSEDKPGWMRKETCRSTEEIVSGAHYSSYYAVESHPPERAWDIFKTEHRRA